MEPSCLVVGFNREAECFQMQEFYLGIRAPDFLASILVCSESSLYFHFLSIAGTDRREAVGTPGLEMPKTSLDGPWAARVWGRGGARA